MTVFDGPSPRPAITVSFCRRAVDEPEGEEQSFQSAARGRTGLVRRRRIQHEAPAVVLLDHPLAGVGRSIFVRHGPGEALHGAVR